MHVYPSERVVVLDIQNLWEFDQLIRDGYRVELDVLRTEKMLAPVQRLPGQVLGIAGFPCYRTVEEMLDVGAALAASKPQIAEWLDIGDSELKRQNQGGYDIRVLHVSNRSIPGPKPVLMIQGAIHAREYVTAETVTRFAEQLVQGYGNNADITWMVDAHDIHLVLVANPDGRKVAEISTTRTQRKNRNPGFVCSTDNVQTGIDLNRNYAFDFGGAGTTATICAQTTRGPNAFSESESSALKNYMIGIFPDQRAETSLVPPDQTTPILGGLDASGIFLDVHSNGAGVWYPWGNTTAGTAPNQAAIRTFAAKIGQISGLPATRSSDFGAIGGATDDYAFGTLGVAGMTVEMSDGGTGTGFFPACTTFETIGPPAVASFFMAARLARLPYRLAAGPDVLNLVVTGSATGVNITGVANDTRFSTRIGPAEPVQNVVSVALFLTPPWQAGALPIAAFAPSDGAFDSAIETISAAVTNAQIPDVGKTLVYVQATDAAGNLGPVSAVFVGPFRDGFE
jgi:carboxypeptidase T